MKIYVLTIKRDYSHSFNGMDDIEVSCFSTLEKAQECMKEEYYSVKDSFEYLEDDDLEDFEFMISDGIDYHSARIEASELN